MAGAGIMEFQNSAMLRHPHHLTSAQLMTHNHSAISATGPSFGSWETRESSPMSIDTSHQSQLTKDGERTLNFSTSPHEDEFGYGKKKTAPRDPMSHRIIEKRRRDRMNNCLADLSRLIPSSYLRKGRGRIEKTEIIEMAIKHIRGLQAKLPPGFNENDDQTTPVGSPGDKDGQQNGDGPSASYQEGFKDCLVDVLQYLVDSEGFFVSEGTGSRLLKHMQQRMGRLGFEPEIRDTVVRDISQATKASGEASPETHSIRASRKDYLNNQAMAYRNRAMSSTEAMKGIRISSDYDSEHECQPSGISGNNSRGSPHSSLSRSQNSLSAEDKNSSQLREMLQSPFNTWGRNYRPVNNTSGGEMEPLEPTKITSSKSVSQTTGASPSSSTSKETEPTPSSYNFKRNIKERFHQELRRTSEPEIKIEDESVRLGGKRRPDSPSSGSTESVSEAQDSLAPPEFITSGANKRRASGSPGMLSSSSVAVFVLHPSGTFYVPSFVNANAIEFEEPPKGTNTHPITLSVNFQGAAHINLSAMSSHLPPHRHSMFVNSPHLLTAGHMPFLQAGQLPFLTPMPGLPTPMSLPPMPTMLRRGSLPLGPSKESGSGMHYGFVGGGQPVPSSSIRSSPHVLNLSQPHARQG